MANWLVGVLTHKGCNFNGLKWDAKIVEKYVLILTEKGKNSVTDIVGYPQTLGKQLKYVSIKLYDGSGKNANSWRKR